MNRREVLQTILPVLAIAITGSTAIPKHDEKIVKCPSCAVDTTGKSACSKDEAFGKFQDLGKELGYSHEQIEGMWVEFSDPNYPTPGIPVNSPEFRALGIIDPASLIN